MIHNNNNINTMKVQDLISIRGKQKLLELQRQKKIRYRLLNKQKQQLANTPERKSNKHKTKRIQKKKFQTVVQKPRKPAPVLQSNVTVETFLNESSDYKKYVMRTRDTIGFDWQELLNDIRMLKTVWAKNKKNNPLLSIEIKFDGMVVPPVRPFQMKLPYPMKVKSVIVITDEQQKFKQNIKSWHHSYDLELLTLRQFRTNFKDSHFHAKTLSSNTLIFCDFKDFQDLCDSPIYEEIAYKNAVFPIETRRLCRSVEGKFSSYAEFMEDLCRWGYFLVRPGKEFTVHVGDLGSLGEQQNGSNVLEGTVGVVARLLEKNKVKGVRVVEINLRTTFSIPVLVYRPKE